MKQNGESIIFEMKIIILLTILIKNRFLKEIICLFCHIIKKT
jgi:hypothetical protein